MDLLGHRILRRHEFARVRHLMPMRPLNALTDYYHLLSDAASPCRMFVALAPIGYENEPRCEVQRLADSFALPKPPISEQQAIVDYIQEETCGDIRLLSRTMRTRDRNSSANTAPASSPMW